MHKKAYANKGRRSLNEEGVVIQLLKRSPFFHAPAVKVRDRILRMLVLTCLSPSDDTDEYSETPFGKALLQYVAKYNETHKDHPGMGIKDASFYDTVELKALPYFTHLAITGVIISRLLSAAWIRAYRINRKNKRKYTYLRSALFNPATYSI